jgi:cytochrome c-type biogenesis protein CcmE
MSSLDQELQDFVDHPEKPSGNSPQGRPSRRQRPERSEPQRNRWLLLVLLGVVVGVVALVMNFREDAVYAMSVDKLIAQKAKFQKRPVRVEGSLVKGSLKHQDKPCEYRFNMTHNGAVLPVRYAKCVVPDTFRDVPDMDVKVTVEGKLSESGTMEASLLMAKCPSKYDMKDRAKKGEKAPHASIPVN